MINEALGEECEGMIIEANHRPICWAREHNDQSALFNNPRKSNFSVVYNIQICINQGHRTLSFAVGLMIATLSYCLRSNANTASKRP